MLDQLYQFEGFYKRPPHGWRDFRYGWDAMQRARAAETLNTSRAVRTAFHANGDDYVEHANILRTEAGLTR